MIRPLVQEARKPHERLVPIAIYMLGTVSSAAVVGMILGSLGSLIVSTHWLVPLVSIVAFVGIGLALCDFGVAGMRTPTLRRQTNPRWWRTIGRYQAIFLWGIDLGLGFTTIRTTSLYWVVVLMIFVLASPVLGAFLLGAYGLALAINLGVSILYSVFKDRSGLVGHTASTRARYLFAPLKKALAVILLLWCLLLLALVASSILLPGLAKIA